MKTFYSLSVQGFIFGRSYHSVERKADLKQKLVEEVNALISTEVSVPFVVSSNGIADVAIVIETTDEGLIYKTAGAIASLSLVREKTTPEWRKNCGLVVVKKTTFDDQWREIETVVVTSVM